MVFSHVCYFIGWNIIYLTIPLFLDTSYFCFVFCFLFFCLNEVINILI